MTEPPPDLAELVRSAMLDDPLWLAGLLADLAAEHVCGAP